MTKKTRFFGFVSLFICGSQVFCSANQSDNPYKFSEITEQKYRSVIERFIDCIKNNKIQELSKFVVYPLNRRYPIPPITSADDFVKRYHQIFDEKLIKQITQSDISNDWDTAGWRGIMFDDGNIWLDYDGKLKSVHYRSRHERYTRRSLIEDLRSTLHPSLRRFARPVLDGKTEKFLIRIDDVGGEYRYAAWSLPKKCSDEPDIVMYGGTERSEGSAGLVYYTFKRGAYTYEIDPNQNWGSATLEVFNGKKRIVHQKFIELHW